MFREQFHAHFYSHRLAIPGHAPHAQLHSQPAFHECIRPPPGPNIFGALSHFNSKYVPTSSCNVRIFFIMWFLLSKRRVACSHDIPQDGSKPSFGSYPNGQLARIVWTPRAFAIRTAPSPHSSFIPMIPIAQGRRLAPWNVCPFAGAQFVVEILFQMDHANPDVHDVFVFIAFFEPCPKHC